jgi:hypothetical protein
VTNRRLSREQSLWLLGLVVVVIAVGGIGASIWFGLTSDWNRTDVIAAMGVIIGVAAFLLAAIAAVVAVAAFGVATQAPDLEPQILFPGSEVNSPVLIIDPSQTQAGVFAKFVRTQLLARVRIYNHSSFPGRNPSFRIELVNMSGVAVPQPSQRWEITDQDQNGYTKFQWDSAGTSSAHAKWATYLPNLRLEGLMTVGSGIPQILLEVVAEGMNEPVRKAVTVKTISPQDWFAAHPDQKGLLPPHLQLLVDPKSDPV